jgi:hypothetical protein
MSYTVIWRSEAIDELTIAWMMAQDRDAVSVASAQIDRVLRESPLDQGESREHDTRVFLFRHLALNTRSTTVIERYM